MKSGILSGQTGGTVWNERCHGLAAGQAMREFSKHIRGLALPDHGTRPGLCSRPQQVRVLQ